MSIKYFILIFLGLFLIGAVNAQTQLKHEKKIYVSPEGKVYVNKSLPIYVKISTSPDDKAQSFRLPSTTTALYANPMYFDSEGRNTLRSPWAVDTVTKKLAEPKIDIQFEVYADSKPPVTSLNIQHKYKYNKNGVIYYGKDIKLEFKSYDEVSGTEATFVSVNKGEYVEKSKINQLFDQEKEYVIAYYSVDKVGNVEVPKHTKFFIDNTPPKTEFKIIGESKGKVLSSKAAISLSSKDSLSGVNRIIYSINDGPEKIYTTPILLAGLSDGKLKITYYAVDNTGNSEEAKVIAASTDKPDQNNENSTFNFYIDKEPPEVSYEIVGDQSPTGKYIFISPRSLFKINAFDEKSGVDKVLYSVNNAMVNQIYSSPFTLNGEGLQTVFFAASDNVGNFALPKSQQLYIDKTIPATTLSFNGRVYKNRDTAFITGTTKIVLSTFETGSGIQSVQYSLDGNGKTTYIEPFMVEKEGLHNIEYFATDKVNNIEKAKKLSFYVDNTPPQIHYYFSINAIGEKTIRDEKYIIYPSNTMLYIAATDNSSGSDIIQYTINGKPSLNVIPVKGLVPGNYEIEISAYDMLHNKSVETVRFAIED